MVEANVELTADRLHKVMASRRDQLRGVLPRARRRGQHHLEHAEARLGAQAGRGADRDLPQAAAGRPADAGHGDGAVRGHVLRSAQVRLLARGPAEVQHQALREPGRDAAGSPDADAGGFLRDHSLPAEAAQEHRHGGRHRSPGQPPRARGGRADGEPVPHRPGAHGARHQGKDERVSGAEDGDAARPDQRQAGDGGDPRVLRIVAVVAVHGPDQSAVGDHAQAAAFGTWAGRFVA